MHTLIRTLAAAGAVALVTAAAILPEAAGAQQTTRKLTYATYIPESFAMTKADLWFMDEVTKRTNGRITFEKYFSGSLLKASDILPGVSAGAADIGNSVPSAYNRQDYPLSNITLPFVTDRVDSVTYAFKSLYEANPQFRKEYEGRNLKLLYAPAYAENTIWSMKPITKPGDLKGLRVRAVLAIGDALSKQGASTVAVPWPDAVEGMRRGVVDAMSAAPFDTAVSGGLADIASHASDAGQMGVYAVSATVINQRTFNSLDKETQQVIVQVASEVPAQYFRLLDEVIDASAKKVADKVKSGSLKVAFFADSDVQQMRASVAQEIQKEWIAVAAKGGNDGRALLDEYMALTRKFDTQSKYVPGFQRVRKLSQ
jgi:TRAP-type C4-dicarboxylate transport system substrate-binding protein